MQLDATSNVLPFPSQRLSRRDHALIEQWRTRAKGLGIAGVKVRDDIPGNAMRPATDRIAIQFQRGVADHHFVVIQRAAGERAWTSVLLRVEPDGSMTLPIEEAAVIRRDPTLREALNAVRPVTCRTKTATCWTIAQPAPPATRPVPDPTASATVIGHTNTAQPLAATKQGCCAGGNLANRLRCRTGG